MAKEIGPREKAMREQREREFEAREAAKKSAKKVAPRAKGGAGRKR